MVESQLVHSARLFQIDNETVFSQRHHFLGFPTVAVTVDFGPI
jgi:hypothetical protein